MERQPAQKFEDLVVWQKSHALVLRTYKTTRTFPKDELFGITSQMRRAAVSVPANIAEAFSKKSKADKARILNISQASLEELRYYFILSKDLGYLPPDGKWEDLSEVARLLGAYIRAINNSRS